MFSVVRRHAGFGRSGSEWRSPTSATDALQTDRRVLRRRRRRRRRSQLAATAALEAAVSRAAAAAAAAAVASTRPPPPPPPPRFTAASAGRRHAGGGVTSTTAPPPPFIIQPVTDLDTAGEPADDQTINHVHLEPTIYARRTERGIRHVFRVPPGLL